MVGHLLADLGSSILAGGGRVWSLGAFAVLSMVGLAQAGAETRTDASVVKSFAYGELEQ
jgi:hypothetical protein